MEYTSIIIEANGRVTLKVGSQEVLNLPSNLYLSVNDSENIVCLSTTPSPDVTKNSIPLNPAKITTVNGVAFSGTEFDLYAALKPFFNT